jgi:hypothetical protein
MTAAKDQGGAGAAALPAQHTWRPMASAPKDRIILVADREGDIQIASWGDCCPGFPASPNMKWCVNWTYGEHGYHTIDAVAWQPLPAPPKETVSDERDGTTAPLHSPISPERSAARSEHQSDSADEALDARTLEAAADLVERALAASWFDGVALSVRRGIVQAIRTLTQEGGR